MAHQNPILSSVLLLLALAAGSVTTHFVPEYHERTTVRTHQSARASDSDSSSDAASDVTGVDVDLRHLSVIATIV